MSAERPLEEMTLRQLRRVASDLAVSRYSRMRKDQLLDAIKAAQRSRVSTSPSRILEAQSEVEAAKFDVGLAERPSVTLAVVDEDLSLPAGYGDSRIVLMPRDPQWAYAYWDIPNEHKEYLRRQGGVRLALRFYDVTDISDAQRPHSLQQYECDELAREWYLPVPVSDREYAIEIGYIAMDGRWLLLARSATVRIPPVYPSDWVDDQFVTIDWDDELRGKTVLKLDHPARKYAEVAAPVPVGVFAMAQAAEAQRVAGSVSTAETQSPEQSVSSYVFPSGVGKWAEKTASGAGMSGVGMSGAGMSGAGISARTESGAGMSGVGMSGAGMSGAGMSGVGMSGVGLSARTESGAGMSGVGLYSTSGTGMSGAGLLGRTESGAGMSGIGLSARTESGAGMSGIGLSARTESGSGMSGVGMYTASGMGHMSGAGLLGRTESGAGISSAGMSGVGMSGTGMYTASGMGNMSGLGLLGRTESGAGMSGAGMSGVGMYSTSGMGMSGAGLLGRTESGAGMSGVGMSGTSMYSTSGMGMSGAGIYTMSGMGMSGVGFSASMPPIRPRQFWLVADAELIVYGATEPDAIVTIGGRPIQLNSDGTFRFQMSFQDGLIDFPIMAVAADGEQIRSLHMKFTRETPERHTNTKEEAIPEWLP